MRRSNQRKLIAVAAVLTLSVALPAWAHGGPMRGGDHHGGPNPSGTPPAGDMGEHGGIRGGNILGQLLFPCPANCADADRSCNQTADTNALSCISEACPSQITAAQTSCASGRGTQACTDALTALQTCAQTCLATRQTDVAACRTAYTSCRAACATPTPTPAQ